MKKTLLTLSLSLLCAVSADAAFVSFITGGARGHEFVLSTGARVDATAVTPSNVAVVGYLTTANDSSSFVEFARTTINNPLSSQAIGGFVNTKTPDQPSASVVSAVKGAQVAVWVYGQGGQQGLFTSDAWAAPATLTTEIDSSWDIRLGVASASDPAFTATALAIPGFNLGSVSVGTITVGTGSNALGTTYTLGAAVPEPSAVLVSVLGLVGLAARRRR